MSDISNVISIITIKEEGFEHYFTSETCNNDSTLLDYIQIAQKKMTQENRSLASIFEEVTTNGIKESTTNEDVPFVFQEIYKNDPTIMEMKGQGNIEMVAKIDLDDETFQVKYSKEAQESQCRKNINCTLDEARSSNFENKNFYERNDCNLHIQHWKSQVVILKPEFAESKENQLWYVPLECGNLEPEASISVISLKNNLLAELPTSHFLGVAKLEVLSEKMKDKYHEYLPIPTEHQETYYSGKSLPLEEYPSTRIVAEHCKCLLLAYLVDDDLMNFDTCFRGENPLSLEKFKNFGENYEDARRDFLIRSGLVDEHLLIRPEERGLLYEACKIQLDNENYVDYQAEASLEKLLAQFSISEEENDLDFDEEDEEDYDR